MRDINDQITRDLVAHAGNQVVEVLRRTGRLTPDIDSRAKLHTAVLLSVFGVTVGTLLVNGGVGVFNDDRLRNGERRPGVRVS